jgi:2-polyprenyl-6-methoxyphenol hydroxylase-like FAD-dependent oxidoreductase
VGDAAHAMSPNMGQGGCQALEDAPALAQSFQRYGDDYTAALRAYEIVRKPRARRVALNSRRIGKISQVSNRMLYPVRNVLVRSFYTQALSKELIWLLRA